MTRSVSLGSPVMRENDRIADGLRQRFHRDGTLCLNLVSSPGAGKTMLLERTLERWGASSGRGLDGRPCDRP